MSDLSGLNPTPHAIAVYASRPLSPGVTQHSLPSGRCPLLGPVFHRLDRTSLPGALIRSPHRRGRAGSAALRGRAPWPVCRLMTNSNLVGCTTGKSAGFSPLRIRTGIDTSLTMGVGPVYSVAHQAPGLRQI